MKEDEYRSILTEYPDLNPLEPGERSFDTISSFDVSELNKKPGYYTRMTLENFIEFRRQRRHKLIKQEVTTEYLYVTEPELVRVYSKKIREED